MHKRCQASPDDGDALALTFAQPVEPAEVEEEDEEENFVRYTGSSSGWNDATLAGTRSKIDDCHVFTGGPVPTQFA